MIAAQRPNYPIVRMCRWAGVSESGYHAWSRREPSASAVRRTELAEKVREAFEASNGVFGYRKVHARLKADGVKVCDRVVREIMSELGLKSCHPRPWRCVTSSDGTPPAPDLIERNFAASGPGMRLVGDITQIDTWEGPLFLSTVIDLFNREVVGYAMANNHRTDLICEAIVMARTNRRTRQRAIFHSDRGSEYTSRQFTACLKHARMRPSMGSVGCAYDNAVAESFFATIKKELVHRTAFPTRAKAIEAISNYIEVFYNHQRLHESLEYETPANVRANHYNNEMAA